MLQFTRVRTLIASGNRARRVELLRYFKTWFDKRCFVKKIEYPIVEHCNLSCVHCDHASPLLPRRFTAVDQYDRDLKVASQVLHAQEFCVLGGEPLLHPELLEVLSIAKKHKIADVITLVTNGSLLHSAPAAMWRMIDKLWISVYPGIVIRPSIENISKLCAEHGVVLYVRHTTEFGQRLINIRNTDTELVRSIYTRCKIAHHWQCYSIHDGHFYKCSIAPFTKGRLSLRNVEYDACDGVRLHGNRNLTREIEQYLNSKDPLEACYFCLGTSGSNVPHRQVKRSELSQSLRCDDAPLHSLIRIGELANQTRKVG